MAYCALLSICFQLELGVDLANSVRLGLLHMLEDYLI